MVLNSKPNSFLDLRGIECPLNYVKTKLELDKMKSGNLLELWIDDGEAINTVPTSINNDGNIIESIERLSGYYKLLIIKS